MKKIIVLALVIIANNTFAQDLKKVLLDNEYQVEFVGIDFSKTKMVGSPYDFGNPQMIANEYFIKWNNFFYREADKYNMQRTLRKDAVKLSIEAVEKVNNEAETSVMLTTKTPASFSKDALQQMVQVYDYNPRHDVSVVIIVNALNKLRGQFVANIVFFNSNTREIIFENELISEPGGLGFRNYWLGGIHNFLNKVRKDEYKNWKKKYK